MQQQTFFHLAAGMILAAGLAAGQDAPMPARFGPVHEFLPVAVWYGGGKARAPMLERDPRARAAAWRKDLAAIRALGFNAIRAWVDWASAEPEEGRYNFDTLEVLLDLAAAEDLRVMVQVYLDSAPEWLGRKYPDARYVAINGYAVKPEAAPGYCNDHPGVGAAERRFFEKLAARMAQSKAFLGWDLWSEPHVINWAAAPFLANAEYCYCPHTAARYRGWLKAKYTTLDALNEAWYRRFATWDEVEPNRLTTILSYSDYIDWRTFIQDKLAADLAGRREAVKRFAPRAIATSHSAISSVFTSPTGGDGNPDDWLMAPQVDYYGTSFYPKHSRPVGYDPAWRGALLDSARASGYAEGGNGFYVGELQGGFGTVALNVGATVTPADLRMWAWSALARGAKGINFYAWYPMSSGYESGGYGLIELDGTITERARVAGRIARTVAAHQPLLLAARPPRAEVAIVYNPLNYLVGGRQRVATASGPQSEVAGIERNSMLGYYRALFAENVDIDFVHVRRLDAARLAQYKLLILPYPLMLPAAAAAPLGEYVRQGGALVTEARAGWTNERGWASEIIPGLGLHQVLGCREAGVQTVPGLKTELVWSGEPRLLPDGTALNGRLYEEVLEPLGGAARVVARWAGGAPAAVLSRYGRGRTLTIGTYLGVAYEQTREEPIARLARGLLEWAGVSRPLDTGGAGVEARLLESGAARLVFLFNHGTAEARPRLTLRLAGEYAAQDFETGAAAALTGAPGAWQATLHLPPGGVQVLRLTPRGGR